MKKRALSLILIVALSLSLCPWAMAAETRETDFFEDQPHTELTFSEIEYRRIDTAPILEEMDSIRALAADENQAEAVAQRFQALADQVMELLTMYTLSNILVYQDAANSAYVEENTYTHSAYLETADAFSLLIRDLLASPCGAWMRQQLSQADADYYSTYQAMTSEEMARAQEEQSLLQEYQLASLRSYAVNYQGRTYDENAVYTALAEGSLDAETADGLLTEIVQAQNAALGEIYLRMVRLRQEIAVAAEYENYGDYAYDTVYTRDYTQEEILPFCRAVAANITPVSNSLAALVSLSASDKVFTTDYSGDTAIDMIQPYIGQMSSELAEALDYMVDHQMYDLAYSDSKQGVGFTTMLYSYGAPFMFNQPTGSFYDFSTLVHELGHYNNYYWDGTDWNDAADNIDTSEVHSQGLELLFTHYYSNLFGTSAQAAQDYLMANLTGAMVQGCLIGELEQYVYATENVTLQQINQKYLELLRAYGMADVNDGRTEAYGWVQIPHMFQSPCYYISYAVSAAGAFSFWRTAQSEGFEGAVDQYLSFVASPAERGLQESFTALGLPNPLEASYIQTLAQELTGALNAEGRLPGAALEAMYSDVSAESWYAEYVLALSSAGILAGYEDGTFRPNGSVTWGEALKLVLLTAGYEEQPPLKGGTWASGYQALALELGILDGEVDLNAAITRQELALLLAGAIGLAPSDSPSPFADVDNGYVTALSELHILTGYTAEDGTVTFNGAGVLKRSEMCAVLYRTLELLAALAEVADAADAAA